MYALVVDGAVVAYPYSADNLRQDNPQVSFPAELNDERLAEWNVVPVSPVVQPNTSFGQEHTEGVPLLENGEWRQNWIVTELSTEERRANIPGVSMRQARLAMLGAGVLSVVDAAIASLPSPQKEAAQIEWEYASTVERSSPLITALAPAMGMTEDQVDELFLGAATL